MKRVEKLRYLFKISYNFFRDFAYKYDVANIFSTRPVLELALATKTREQQKLVLRECFRDIHTEYEKKKESAKTC